MSKEKTPWDRFANLSWDDLNHWVGSKNVSRGRNYQQQGRVIDLVATEDGALIAWVNGSERYATRVTMNVDGLPESLCTCLYELDCKHGAAVVLEYLTRIENRQTICVAKDDDVRVALLENDNWESGSENSAAFISEDLIRNVEEFLNDKDEIQLKELILELCQKYPEIVQDLSDRRQILTGDIESLVERLRREIREIGKEPGWQNPWQEEGYTPDYSCIRTKIDTLLSAGHFEAVLSLGKEIIEVGTHQIEQSHDNGETALEIESCLPAVVKALERCSLDTVDKLVWAVDVVLKDQFDICEIFGEYLYRKHSRAAWDALAHRLLAKLEVMAPAIGVDNFIRNFERDRISNWAIHALERAARKEEIIPLCQKEAKVTSSYNRLVKELMAAGRFTEAERWISEGIDATKDILPGIATRLRKKLLKIRILEKNWPAVTVMQVDLFVQHPSCKTYLDCKATAANISLWPTVSKCLLTYLESGELPWQQSDWPLPTSKTEPTIDKHNRQFPMIDDLIEIAVMEEKPDQVLHWYNQISKERMGWYGIDEDLVASAIEKYAPQRAVSFWKYRAEQLIEEVKANSYKEAVKCLRKAATVMEREKMKERWQKYLSDLRLKHIHKQRLVELLDGLEGRPIVSIK